MKVIIHLFLGLLIASSAAATVQISSEPTSQLQIEGVDVEGAEWNQAFALSQYMSHNFGIVQVNSYNATSFQITNSGNQEIRLSYPYVSGMYYSLSSACPSSLRPYSSCSIRVVYWPMSQGYHSGQMSMSTSDGSVSATLYGQAQ